MKFDDFLNFFKYYEGKPHQDKSLQVLYDELEPRLKDDLSEWVRIYRRRDTTPPSTTKKVLDVPYFSQRDNYRDANRTCFSSSCAMMLKYLKPDAISGDDDYIKTVFDIGDTTEAWVHQQALAKYGVEAQFIQNGDDNFLRSQIDAGKPVPVGILHHGPASAPSGGGHWLCVIGYDDKGFIVNDPWGEIDHASGTYISTNGERLHYSSFLMGSRWTVAGDSDGWAIKV